MKYVGGNISGLWHKLTQGHVVFMCIHTHTAADEPFKAGIFGYYRSTYLITSHVI